jgi:hypothetical protein
VPVTLSLSVACPSAVSEACSMKIITSLDLALISAHDANNLIKINLRAICYLLLFIILRYEFHHNI